MNENIADPSRGVKYEDAITKLEDHGYSYYFSQRVLQLAHRDGSWMNVIGDLEVLHHKENGRYTVRKSDRI